MLFRDKNTKFKRVLTFIIILTLFAFSKDFILQIPQGFPTPYIPEDNQLTTSRVELGRKLFFDKIMSRDSSVSCASCHVPAFAFTDRLIKGKGIRNQEVGRNTPTLTNVAYQDKFLWDGVNPSLVAQVMIPIHETNEFDFHIILLAERMKKDSTYVKLCKEAYNSNPNPYAITHSIASFERTLLSGNSPYDQFHFQGDKSALNSSEKRGMDLFFNKLHCTECHSGFNFTNNSLTNNGLYQNYPDSGRIRLTYLETDRAVFKVPTLRNIELTYPYMHDGSIKTLEDVVSHYMNGGKNHENKSEIIKPFELTKQEKSDLIHFLESLTDSTFINTNYEK